MTTSSELCLQASEDTWAQDVDDRFYWAMEQGKKVSVDPPDNSDNRCALSSVSVFSNRIYLFSPDGARGSVLMAVFSRQIGLLKTGDTVVGVHGWQTGQGHTNTIRMLVVA